MFRIIYTSMFLTGLIYLIDSFKDRLRHICYYLLIFLAIIGSHFLISELYADEHDDYSAYVENIHNLFVEYRENINTQTIFTGEAHWVDDKPKPHKKHLNYYKNLSLEHGSKGLKYWKKANELKIVFPQKDDRERARSLLEAGLLACSAGSTPMSKLVAGMSILVVMQIGDIMDEWNKFLHYLRKSEYHYALSEFYYDVHELQNAHQKKIGITFHSN